MAPDCRQTCLICLFKQIVYPSMKINLTFITFVFVLCLKANAQTNEAETNTFLLGLNDVKDFTPQQQEIGYYMRNVSLHHVVIPEILPASEDTNDIWGNQTNELLLSIRFRKDKYVIGEEIPAISILRNLETNSKDLMVTDSPSIFLTFVIHNGTNEYLPKQQNQRFRPPFAPRHGFMNLTLKPRGEMEIVYDLNEFYDLKAPGEYTVRALCRIYSPETKTPIYEVSSGTTSFQLAEKPPSASGAP